MTDVRTVPAPGEVVALSKLKTGSVCLWNGQRYLVTKGSVGGVMLLVLDGTDVDITFHVSDLDPQVQYLGKGRLTHRIRMEEPHG